MTISHWETFIYLNQNLLVSSLIMGNASDLQLVIAKWSTFNVNVSEIT
jgi:hypothetical protein